MYHHAMKKIVITGTESTGKSTLSKALSEHYNCPFVPEYARTYLDALDRPYRYEDLWKIAEGQFAQEIAMSKASPTYLFLDTDLITIDIWSNFKYGRVDPRILQLIKDNK